MAKEKNRKISNYDWQSGCCLSIICALCVGLSLSAEASPASVSELEMRVREAELARLEAERRVEETGAALETSRRQFMELSRRYADLFLKSKELLEETRSLQLRAAGLVVDGDAAVGELGLARALDFVQEARDAEERLLSEINAFGQYLESVLHMLQPSEAVRMETLERFAKVQTAGRRLAIHPPLVAGRGGEGAGQPRHRVLALDADMQVIVFDAGFSSGLREGMQVYAVNEAGSELASFTVLETRALLSAAVLDAGSMKAVGVGAAIVREKSKP